MPPPAPHPSPAYKKGQLRILDLILGVPGASEIIRQVDYEGVIRWISDSLGVGAGELCSAEGQRQRAHAYRQAIDAYIEEAFWQERRRPELHEEFTAFYASEIQAIAWELQSSWCVVFWLCVQGSWLSFGCQSDADTFQLRYNQEAKAWLNEEIDSWIEFRDEPPSPEADRHLTARRVAFGAYFLIGGGLVWWLKGRKKK